MWRIIASARPLVMIAVLILAASAACMTKSAAVPEASATGSAAPQVVFLKQWPCSTEAECWAERREWYHKSEGAQLMPYSWFMNLKTDDGRPLKNEAARFGFIEDAGSPWCETATYDRSKPEDNCDLLPVGFVKDEQKASTEYGEVPIRLLGEYTRLGKRAKLAEHIGVTCAGCHTSQLTYRKTLIRIDGGGGYGDIEAYTKVMLGALKPAFTDEGFAKFRGSLPKDDETSLAEVRRAFVFAAQLQAQEDCYSADPEYLKNWQPGDGSSSTSVAPSFGRLDGFGRGANNIFGFGKPAYHMALCDQVAEQLQKKLELPAKPDLSLRDSITSLTLTERNPGNAPVRIPAIWNAATYNFVQWNHSVHQPIARNITQALGAYTPKGSVRFANLQWLERSFERISAPAWPEHIFPRIDGAKAEAGKVIFERLCARCHAPSWNDPNKFGQQFRKLTAMDVGTDPRYLQNFASMKLQDSNTKKEKSLADGLKEISTHLRDDYYTRNQFSPQQRAAWDGFRDENYWQAPNGYIARPLNGIWARAPYLHNGSVISLDQLLQPRSSRCEKFWAQPVPEFDPQAVGLSAEPDSAGICGTRSDVSGAEPVNTTVLGNQNQGHDGSEFGTDLPEPKRRELIEYLKCLPRPEGSACPL
jgi:cytochrome c2